MVLWVLGALNSSPCWGRSYIFQKVYSGILLGVFKKNAEAVFFFQQFTQVFFWEAKTAEAVLFFQQFTQVFCWEVKNC